MNQHAVVVGGGIAGLLAAHILSRHYDYVTILERDRYPDAPGFRPGTPQARHLHLFLLKGQQTVEHFFPGISDELKRAGAIECDFVQDGVYSFSNGRVQRSPSHLRGVSCSRGLWEWHIRQRLRLNGRIQFKELVEVVGLVQAPDWHAITGVRIRPRGSGSSATESVLFADLVIDASGRTSCAPLWLEQLGYSTPRETVIDAHLGYASRCYPRALNSDWAFVGVQIQAPARLRGAALFPVEGAQWMLVLMGAGENYPPTDEQEFLAFADSLADPIIAQTIRSLPGGNIYGYRNTQNCYRHYEHCRMPEGLLVIGDAYCAFNPAYGQGMTVAALEAVALGKALKHYGNNHQELAKCFYSQAAGILAFPWMLATSSDNRVPNVKPTARLSLMTKFLYAYNDTLLELVPRDTHVRDVFFGVWHMLRPSETLFHPSLVAKVIKYRLRQARKTRNTLIQEGRLQPAAHLSKSAQ